MYVISAGCAYPQTVINNAFLAELSPQHPASYIGEITGIRERRSVLTPEYLRERGNIDVRESLAGSLEGPTELGCRAAEMALQRAGIARESVGLILGDCATPLQTIPAEAQRIAAQLSIKVLSYDLPSFSASLALALQSLSSWKDEKVPDYVLCVSTNTPTQRVHYRIGGERLYFGDAAAAVLVSSRMQGKFRLRKAFYGSDPTRKDSISIPLQGHLDCSSRTMSEISRTDDEMLQRAVEETQAPLDRVRWISGRLEPQSLKQSAAKRGIHIDHVWHTLDRCGNSLGSTVGCVLAERWDKAACGDLLVCTFAGIGYSFGYVVLEVL